MCCPCPLCSLFSSSGPLLGLVSLPLVWNYSYADCWQLPSETIRIQKWAVPGFSSVWLFIRSCSSACCLFLEKQQKLSIFPLILIYHEIEGKLDDLQKNFYLLSLYPSQEVLLSQEPMLGVRTGEVVLNICSLLVLSITQ